jgi:hypothetical protein
MEHSSQVVLAVSERFSVDGKDFRNDGRFLLREIKLRRFSQPNLEDIELLPKILLLPIGEKSKTGRYPTQAGRCATASSNDIIDSSEFFGLVHINASPSCMLRNLVRCEMGIACRGLRLRVT